MKRQCIHIRVHLNMLRLLSHKDRFCRIDFLPDVNHQSSLRLIEPIMRAISYNKSKDISMKLSDNSVAKKRGVPLIIKLHMIS
ncbi:MAG: hypothetical protein ETSY1_07425 [Candidatus Entotheonella factor]|uniref:Uncharacterized protein n=1 Tax=Entotheonella factor TaxID=1429438 RepID=W4LUA1_ENTF1|nr:MAG: hypothetical protein ETSY1_07425 [Candidatus Entotheonella factor]